jgi:hypothetical protein
MPPEPAFLWPSFYCHVFICPCGDRAAAKKDLMPKSAATSSKAANSLVAAVRQLRRGTVLVVGDVMLDRYVYGRVSRVSPEAPVPVLAVERELALPGGAGNVVRNLTALGAAVAYFSFQLVAAALWGASLPAPPAPDGLEWGLIVLAILSFGLVAVAQALFPLWAHHPATAGLRVHLANGLYLNALLDRLIGGFRASRPL